MAYFYSGQIRRFISQFIRMVSNFEFAIGTNSQGATVTQRVPVIFGDPSRQAAQILQGNSENTLNTVPAMAVYITGLKYDRERVQDPTLIQKVHLRERRFDPETGTYSHEQGDAYTIERLMPVPYRLTIKLDIWTSNIDQKLQLLEQISQLFNPASEIQNTDNYVDWTSLSYVLLVDTNWDSRTVPVGNTDPISVATMTFELPIWISTSAKVKKLGVIHQVINNMEEWPDGQNLGGRIISLLDYGVRLFQTGNTYQLKLLKSGGVRSNDRYVGISPESDWDSLLEQYGRFIPGASTIRLRQYNGTEVVGTIAPFPGDPTVLIYNPFPDTLPANTLDPINAVVDPENANVDSLLVNPPTGTRYLIIKDIGSDINDQGALAWRGSNGQDLIAHAGDIVEYNGTHWEVVFDSQTEQTLQYVTNLVTGIQYQWVESEWIKSVDGTYPGGEWSLSL